MQQLDDDFCEGFQKGADARAAGKGRDANPYGPGTPERKEWDRGWAATYDLDEDSDPASLRVRDDEVE